jgi:hypothetical protein
MGQVNPRAIVWLEGLGQLKTPMTSLGIKSMNFWLVAVPQPTSSKRIGLCKDISFTAFQCMTIKFNQKISQYHKIVAFLSQ